MHDRLDHAPCETFARLIERLSTEIRQLLREIPLRQGQLLELEGQSQPNEDAIRSVAEQIQSARARLRIAEIDLVALERIFRKSCAAGAT